MKNISLLVLASFWVVSLPAQTFSILKEFSAPQYVYANGGPWTNADGGHSVAKLANLNGVLYGTTFDGGSAMGGVVFKINLDGTAYSVLKHLGTGVGYELIALHSYGGLSTDGGRLYGTTGTSVFGINPDGSGFGNIWSSILNGGVIPQAGVTLVGPKLFGTAANKIFTISTNGTGYSVLRTLTGNDGTDPHAALLYHAGWLYGTASRGGSTGYGTIFKISTNGSGFAVLKTFVGSDGRYPQAGLTVNGSVLYGTTETGGTTGGGVVFKINTDGTGYSVLKNLGGSDGSRPVGDLLLDGSILYGTAYDSGSGGSGVVFKLNTDGAGFSVLKTFARGMPNELGVYTNSDGAFPKAGLVKSGNALYGTTWGGGASGNGNIFRITLPGGSPSPIPVLAQRVGNNLVLSWSNPDFSLQAAPKPDGVFTNVPGAVSPYTNLMTQPQHYFRLIAN